MDYTYDRTLTDTTLDEADARVRAALKDKGFGVLTEIDVQKTMQQKIGAEMDGYRILGACNPKMAWEAIGLEPRIGAMLPCNVILRSVEGGTEVSAIDPVASMSAVDNARLHEVAGEVRDMLKAAIDAARRRTLGYAASGLAALGLDGVTMGTGVMIGAGPLAPTGRIAELAGMWFPLAFLAGAVVTGFSACIHNRRSNAQPSAGGSR